MEKKICARCKQEFTSSNATHDYCYSCYTEYINPKPHCKKCGCVISYDYLYRGREFCDKCFFGKK